MKQLYYLIAAASILALAGCNNVPAQKADAISAGEHTRVQTVYGPVEGYLDGNVYTFKGIRYAKAERFLPPQAPDKFTEVRQCKLYGPQAPQNESLRWSGDTQRDYSFGNQFVVEPMSEDECLVLNVWTKGINDSGKRPVFVWIHGGGYSGGSAHDLPCYEGKSLADKGDIVYVSLNHRLNVLGYTDLTALGGKYENSVNLGMQDIVKALEWIRDNIALFGGDPGSVTIAGQSGGGGKVSTLLAMPSAKGLFKRAIVQSGSTLTLADPAASREYGKAFAEALGQKADATADFSGFSYDELVAAGGRANRILASKGIRGSSGSPVTDGKIVAQNPFDGPNEISKDIPMLIGTNYNEFTFDINVKGSDEQIRENLARRTGADRVDSYIEAFRKAYPEKELKELTYIDLNFRRGAVQQAAVKSTQGGAPAYLYMFTWAPTTNALGASHGMELPFMSNNVALQREMTGSTPDAYVFEDLISNVWLSFIKTGDPNVKGLPTWEPYNVENGPCMILDRTCELRYNHDKELLDFFARR